DELAATLSFEAAEVDRLVGVGGQPGVEIQTGTFRPGAASGVEQRQVKRKVGARTHQARVAERRALRRDVVVFWRLDVVLKVACRKRLRHVGRGRSGGQRGERQGDC